MENENKELELSERQLTILDAIIRNYLATYNFKIYRS